MENNKSMRHKFSPSNAAQLKPTNKDNVHLVSASSRNRSDQQISGKEDIPLPSNQWKQHYTKAIICQTQHFW